VLERVLEPGQEWHRFAWHDRKAWWQQEQAILAYLIMAGAYGDAEYVKLAREFSSFYNAWFPDNDSGAVYFNVLASGAPYLLGTERLKGSHSMSAYHSTELCYLAAVYTNLLLTRQPMEFYFKPMVGGPRDNTLRVAPDLLPPGSVRLEAVWVDGEPYADFDAQSMTVRLPSVDEPADHPLKYRPPWMGDARLATADQARKTSFDVRVRIVPAELAYDIDFKLHDGIAVVEMEGQYDDPAALPLKRVLDRAVGANVKQLVLDMSGVTRFSAACGRAVAFTRKALNIETEIVLMHASPQVTRVFQDLNVLEELSVRDGRPG
jgi:anti-anti-sigma regulatory factor